MCDTGGPGTGEGERRPVDGPPLRSPHHGPEDDPTTAVQCVDRIHELLADLIHRPLGELHHCDRDGRGRLIQPAADWDDIVDLAFTEIHTYGAASPQVSRRLAAAMQDLTAISSGPRRRILQRRQLLLEERVAADCQSPEEQAYGLEPDRQGIG